MYLLERVPVSWVLDEVGAAQFGKEGMVMMVLVEKANSAAASAKGIWKGTHTLTGSDQGNRQ